MEIYFYILAVIQFTDCCSDWFYVWSWGILSIPPGSLWLFEFSNSLFMSFNSFAFIRNWLIESKLYILWGYSCWQYLLIICMLASARLHPFHARPCQWVTPFFGWNNWNLANFLSHFRYFCSFIIFFFLALG